MIVGYLLVSTFAGLLTLIAALVLGASFWFGYAVATLVSFSTLILLALVQDIFGRLARRNQGETDSEHWYSNSSPLQVVPFVKQPDGIVDISLKILAVDDDPLILELLPAVLTEVGACEIKTAGSAEKAFELLINSGTTFDCFLVDIKMPGMDGIEFCRRVRQISQYKKTPIIMLTAAREIHDMSKAYKAGATDYVSKPFDVEEFRARLQLVRKDAQARHDWPVESQESSQYSGSTTTVNRHIKLFENQHLQTGGVLLDHAALSSYLTQLPRTKIADIQVYAVSIDGIEDVCERYSTQKFSLLLEEFLSGLVECFDANPNVMAFTNETPLLIVNNSVNPMAAIDIERKLQGHIAATHPDISVSVGGPVQPELARTLRAKNVTDRAINLAEYRQLSKRRIEVGSRFNR